MQLQEIDSFFGQHPLKEQYFSAPESERSGCAAVAERDVRAAIAHLPEEITSRYQEFIPAAIAEQTIFLLLNPEYLTGAYTRINSLSSAGNSCRFNGQESPLGQRAAALLSPLFSAGEKQEKEVEKDPVSSGNDPSVTSVGCVFLQRG